MGELDIIIISFRLLCVVKYKYLDIKKLRIYEHYEFLGPRSILISMCALLKGLENG